MLSRSPVPFKLFGLQRTGTNLMQLLMTQNFEMSSAEHGTEWKHGPVNDPDRLWNGKPVHFVWCVKNPYAWLASCYKYFQRSWNIDKTVAPQFKENPGMSFTEFVMSPTYEFQSPVHRWNQMNAHWLAQLPAQRRVLVRQEEMVEHQEEVLDRVRATWNLQKRKAEVTTTSKHIGCNMRAGKPISRPYYLEKQYLNSFTRRTLEFVNQYMDMTLMDYFGYALESPEACTGAMDLSPESAADQKLYTVVTDNNALASVNEVVSCLADSQECHSNGRGIVICGGGDKYFPCAWVCIKMLRHLGCTLPIELWHLGKAEMNPAARKLVEPLGVTCMDALDVRRKNPCRILNGWELKPFSIIHSGFSEVLLLDADNVPVVDPTFLFDAPEFQQTGAIFWPDYGRLSPQRSIWQLMGVEHRDEPEFESGQMVIDKHRCERPLKLTMWLNEHSDFWYRHVHGDKETFHMAWRKLHAPYAMPEKPIEALPATMCQHDFQGRRIFQHRNLAKWTFRGNPHIDGFLLETQCLAFLEELLPHWKQGAAVKSFHREDKTPEECAAADHLCSTHWIYDRVGHDQRPMTFKADGTIDQGAARLEMFWNLISLDCNLFLEIYSQGMLTCRLRQEEGVWRGRWERHEKMPIEVLPQVTPVSEARASAERIPMIGVTIGMGTRFMEYARRAARSVEEKAGLMTGILSAPARTISPTLLKLRIFEHFDGTVFYFDADTLLLKDWNLAPYIDRAEFICVRDLPSAGVEKECKKYGLDPTQYFNAGMFIANKKHHAHIFTEASRLLGIETPFGDQTLLNLAVRRLGIPLLLLEERFNFVGYGKRAAPKEVVLAHAAGGESKRHFDRLFPLQALKPPTGT